MTEARAAYVAGKETRTADVRGAEARARSIGTARAVVAIVAIVLVGARVWGPLGGGAWWGVGACVVAFAALVVMHSRLALAAERAAAALRFHERGLKRLDGAWRDLPNDGARFLREDHPYADDLDVFGRASLFQRLDVTETRFGEERLAAWLTAACEPVDLNEVRARQAAVKELAPRVAFREQLSSAGAVVSEDKRDPAAFLAWAEGATPLPRPVAFAVVAWVLPSLLAAGAIASEVFGLSGALWIGPLVVELLFLGATARFFGPIAAAVTSREGSFARFGELLAAIETQTFESPMLRELRETLRASGADSTREMARLQRILSFLDARNNEVWRFFIGPALLWDIHCVVALERWRLRAGPRARAWLESIATIEALASLASFAFESPDFAFPALVESPCFVGDGLGHPLLGAGARVVNDVALAGPGSTLVVTGSNMSGKSTLLRSIGTNAVLALAGGPACAKKLTVGPIRVAASMRVRDSLADGVSRFYAEVRKLKAVIERARASRVPATLFLLDEVLHGTNSRERLIGARAIVRELVARGAIGAVSTHDLALGDLEDQLPESVTNVHFEEQVEGDRMTFDYVLRRGVVKSSNALRIMRMVGIDVVSPE